jgi:hypothetical protein
MKQTEVKSNIFRLSCALALLLLCFLFNFPATYAATNAITRVSTDSAGLQSNAVSDQRLSISRDGRYVAFRSTASNLVASDTNGVGDVFKKDTSTGAITRVSTATGGTQAIAASSLVSNSMSADGRYIAFTTTSALVAADTNALSDVYLKDTLTGTTTRVSTSSADAQTTSGAPIGPVISGDGRYVVFQSTSTNLVAGDTNGQSDVFYKDTQTGVMQRASTTTAGVQGTGGASTDASISEDGTVVVFVSLTTDLVPGDTNAQRDTFKKNMTTGELTRVSVDAQGNEFNNTSFNTTSAVSRDGRYVMFQTSNGTLVPGDTNGVTDDFMKDTLTGAITRTSTDSAGNQSDAINAESEINADATYVAFASDATNLVSNDTNGVRDVFVKNIATGETSRISTDANNQNGDGASGTGAAFVISADGKYFAFSSLATNLVLGDTNAVADIFHRLNPVFTVATTTPPITTTPSVPNTGTRPHIFNAAIYLALGSSISLVFAAKRLVRKTN